MQRKLYLLTFLLLLAFNIFSQQFEHLFTVPVGQKEDEYIFNYPLAVWDQGAPGHGFINEYERVYVLDDKVNKAIKFYDLLTGKYKNKVNYKDPRDFGGYEWFLPFYAKGLFYVFENGSLSIFSVKENKIIRIISGFDGYSVHPHAFHNRGIVYLADKNKSVYLTQGNGTLTPIETVPPWLQPLSNMTYYSNNHAYKNANIFHGHIAGSPNGVVEEFKNSSEGKTIDSQVIFNPDKTGPYRSLPFWGREPVVTMAPSGILYFQLITSKGLEVYRAVPDNLKGRYFAFGYNEDRMVELARRGLDAKPNQADLDFLKTLRTEELKILSQMSYALSGCSFEDELLTMYFESYEWYKPEPGKIGKLQDLTASQQSLVKYVGSLIKK